ncbi:hypothetical protein M0811_04020 [Anaeramoeba ignava]|uniref:Uncharacterized protein n=1 Tax=Anaeramoeba ignava TaxID=1746090 RepID=A0A9Q0LXJ2_ANAIG|nr:hypothetical protein M0811_04020 [Anaeramoeba ignava]
MSQLNSNFSQNSNLFRVNSPNLTDSQDKKTSIGLNFEPSQPGFLFQQPTPTNSFLVSPLHSQLNYPSFLSDFKFSTDSAIFSQNSQNIFNSLNKNNDSNFAKLTPPKSTDSKINIPSDNKLQSFRQKLSFYESESRENSKSTDSNSAQVSSNDSNVHYDLINPENSTELIF